MGAFKWIAGLIGWVAFGPIGALVGLIFGSVIDSSGEQIAANMNYSQRLQLFHYLADLANADGNVCKEERGII